MPALALSRPLQRRSRATMERILQAAERQLMMQSFADLTVADVLAEAGVSIGSFYARFSGKAALLPALYDRYETSNRGKAEELVTRLESAMTLGAACRHVVDALADTLIGNRNLMRALVEFARANPDAPPINSPARALLHLRVNHALMRFAPSQSAAVEEACRFAIFSAASTLREALLYPNAPFAAASNVEPTLRANVSAMLELYLQGSFDE